MDLLLHLVGGCEDGFAHLSGTGSCGERWRTISLCGFELQRRPRKAHRPARPAGGLKSVLLGLASVAPHPRLVFHGPPVTLWLSSTGFSLCGFDLQWKQRKGAQTEVCATGTCFGCSASTTSFSRATSYQSSFDTTR